ncbi:MAG: PCI domain-containing protein [Asgard group archaeon]|nr:PCI domain-containing protein [Asgard group archaeon]
MGYLERSIGPGNFWTLIFGIGFIIWGVLAVIFPRTPGSYWMFIPGGILTIIAISNIINYRYNREKIIGALKSYKTVNLDQLAKELNMKKDEVKEIIVDLRAQGEIKASFDPESGDVVVLAVRGHLVSEPTPGQAPEELPRSPAEQIAEDEKSLKEIKSQGYCPYCGSRIRSSDKFCINCGASLN